MNTKLLQSLRKHFASHSVVELQRQWDEILQLGLIGPELVIDDANLQSLPILDLPPDDFGFSGHFKYQTPNDSGFFFNIAP